MAEVAQEIVEEVAEVIPLGRDSLKFSVHDYQQYSVQPPADTPVESLEDPKLWVHLADKIKEGAEIRFLPRCRSYWALGVCTFSDGRNVRMTIVQYATLKQYNVEDLPSESEKKTSYKIVNRGQSGWCIQSLDKGDWIKEQLPSKNEAQTYLDKYILLINGDTDAAEWIANYGNS